MGCHQAGQCSHPAQRNIPQQQQRLEASQVRQPLKHREFFPMEKGSKLPLLGSPHHAEVAEPISAPILAQWPGKPLPSTAGNRGLALLRKSPFISVWSSAKLEPNQPFFQLLREVSRVMWERGWQRGAGGCHGVLALGAALSTGHRTSVSNEGFVDAHIRTWCD